MKIILIANRKGGVGKTTTAINLASALTFEGKKVLLMDLDTQSHLQYGLGYKKKFKSGMHKALQDKNLVKYIQETQFENLDFIPADINFDVSQLNIKKSTLKKLLSKDKIYTTYDVCIIDTPPTSDILLYNALSASHYALVPMQTEYLGLIGAIQFIKIFYKIASELNTKFTFLGVVPTLFNRSIKDHSKIINKLKETIGETRVFPTIRKDFKLSEAFMHGKPIFYFDRRTRGARDYKILAQEIIQKANL